MEQKGFTTNIVFPTSPIKPIFANERRVGGDGSLGRIRSRFSNGLLSPQRRIAPVQKQMVLIPEQKELEAKNLFEKLEEVEKLECRQDSSAVPSSNKANVNFNSKCLTENDAYESLQTNKKCVKFELPLQDTRSKLAEELREVRKLLDEALKRQADLELRLSKLESQGD